MLREWLKQRLIIVPGRGSTNTSQEGVQRIHPAEICRIHSSTAKRKCQRVVKYFCHHGVCFFWALAYKKSPWCCLIDSINRMTPRRVQNTTQILATDWQWPPRPQTWAPKRPKSTGQFLIHPGPKYGENSNFYVFHFFDFFSSLVFCQIFIKNSYKLKDSSPGTLKKLFCSLGRSFWTG